MMGAWCGFIQAGFAVRHWAMRTIATALAALTLFHGGLDQLFTGVLQSLLSVFAATWAVYGAAVVLSPRARGPVRMVRRRT
jgi:hypothetical protein